MSWYYLINLYCQPRVFSRTWFIYVSLCILLILLLLLMELFEFKRYLGDGAGPSSKPDSDGRLDEYLEKVKERKRRREERSIEDLETANVEKNGHEQNVSPPVERRSKRKKKRDEQVSEDPLINYLEGVKLRKRTREGKLERSNEDVVEITNLTTRECDENVNCLNEDGVLPISDDKHTDVKDKEQENRSEVEIETVNEQSTDPVSKTRKKKKKKGKKSKNVQEKNEVVDPVDQETKELVKEDKSAVTFEVLGAHVFQGKVKVKRVLPRWLAEPTVISASLCSQRRIVDVGKLHRIFVLNLKAMGVKQLFPVQSIVIPHQLRSYEKIHYLWPRDLCVSAPTGSGKTLAYVLPILQAHYIFPKNALYALVVVPVQELALQVAKVFREVANGTGIKIGCITGGTNRDAEAKNLIFKREDDTYASLVHVLVATPGRLMEHFFLTPGFNMKGLKFIVIDEADRIVEQKSLNWLHLIERQCNASFSGPAPPVTFHNLLTHKKGPQKLLFSATLSQDPEKLLKLNLFQPKLITSVSENKEPDDNGNQNHFCGKFTTPACLSEKYVICEMDKKPLLVHKFLVEGWRRVLIFTKSCVEANRLYELLKIMNPDLKIRELTTLMVLGKRQLVVDDFSHGKVDVLVCSDRMARGMDINDVNYVIIYDPPKFAKGYIHKAGRTGRAGKDGTAVTILAPKQCNGFLNMMSKADKTDLELVPFDESELDMFIPSYQDALNSLQSIVSNRKNTKLSNTIKEKRTKTTIAKRRRRRRI